MTDKGRPPELTNVHLRQLTTAVQSIRQDAAEIGLDLEKMPRQLHEKLLGPNLWWAWVYELSMIPHNALHLWSMGAIDQLKLALDCVTRTRPRHSLISQFTKHTCCSNIPSRVPKNARNHPLDFVKNRFLCAHFSELSLHEKHNICSINKKCQYIQAQPVADSGLHAPLNC
jgi:hypothetical protein